MNVINETKCDDFENSNKDAKFLRTFCWEVARHGTSDQISGWKVRPGYFPLESLASRCENQKNA
jgi:hypothetical protein